MEPVTWAIIGTAVISAGIQAWNSAKTQGANQRELDRIRASFESLIPPNLDISPNDPPEYIEKKLEGANFDFSKITPEMYQTIGSYAPQAAQYVAEANPTLVQGSAASKEGRQAQIDALRGYKQMAKGENPELRAAIEASGAAAQQQAQSRSQSLLQDAQRRGGLNSGLSYAAMLQGNSDAMTQGADNARAGALEAYRSKMDALRMSGDMGRQLASDENSVEQANANTINDFNQRTSKNYQAYLQNRQELANQAQMYNLQSQQATADKNTNLSNDTNRFNQSNQNSLAQQQYGNNRDERNYQNTIAQQKASWSAGEKDRQNQLKQSAYNNQLQKANGMAGIGAQQIQMNNSANADRNNAISGVGQAAGGAMAAQQQNKSWEAYLASRNKTPSPGAQSNKWDEAEQEEMMRGMA